jgi:hypothetical protein
MTAAPDIANAFAQSTLPGLPVLPEPPPTTGADIPYQLPHILSDPLFDLPDFEVNCAVYTIRGRFFVGSASFWSRAGLWSCISFTPPLSWMSSVYVENMAQDLKSKGLFAIWGRKKVNPYRENHPVDLCPKS